MLKFKYKAVNIDKKRITGVFLAGSERELRMQLNELGLYLVSAKEITKKTPVNFFSFSSKVKMAEITMFCRQFSIMINANVSILKSIDTLKSQSYSSLFKRVLQAVYEDIRSGRLLSEALRRHKKIFPEFFVSMCYVGEMSGSLDMILDKLAEYYENDSRMRRKIKSAMMYPIVLMLLTVGVLVLMLVLVIPMFEEYLKAFNTDMPPLTKTIMDASAWFQENGGFVLAGAAAVIGIIVLAGRTKGGRVALDKLRFSIPLLKNVIRSIVASRFSRGFGVLFASGMPVVEALEIMSNVLGNKYVEKRFKNAIEQVKKGESLAEAFEHEDIFPAILIQMVAVGENTGTLDDVLLRTSNFFDDQVESNISRVTALIEPVMMLVMGGIIALVFLAMYSPLLSIMQNLDDINR